MRTLNDDDTPCSPPQMIHNYMEHVERIKMQQFSDTSESSTVGRVRWGGGALRLYQTFLFPVDGPTDEGKKEFQNEANCTETSSGFKDTGTE